MSEIFVFDDELYFGQDERCEIVDGYLWAMDSLVERMKKEIEAKHSAEELETLDNINFYPVYNLSSSTIKIEGTYYYTVGTKEKQGEFELPLSFEERAVLIEVMEAYCKINYGKTCAEVLNEVRAEEGLHPFLPPDKLARRSSLNECVETARAEKNGASVLKPNEHGRFIEYEL